MRRYLPLTPRVSEPMAWLLIGLWLVGGVMLMVGWHARIGGGMLTLALAASLLSDQQIYSNHLYLMLPVAALLTVADSGAAISLDARRAARATGCPAGRSGCSARRSASSTASPHWPS